MRVTEMGGAFKSVASVLAVILIFSCAVRSPAQNAGATGQLDTMQQNRALERSARDAYKQGENAPELYLGETNDIGPQSVLIIKPRRTYFEVIADSQYFYTDNAFLTQSGRVESGVLVSTAQVALAPTPYELWGGYASPRIGFRSQWYNFFEYSSHTPNLSQSDFNAQTAFIDERWMYDQWTFGLGFDYTRLVNLGNYDQFYQEYVPRWEARRDFTLCSRASVSVGYEGRYHFTDQPLFPGIPNNLQDRLDQTILAALNIELCSHAILQPYYRFQYTHFYNEFAQRDDYLQSTGVGLYCFLNKWCSARAFAAYDWRNSTLTFAEYHVSTAGVGLNLDFRF